MLTAHRQSPNFAREQREKIWRRAEEILGPRGICGRCGATFKTFEDKCQADVDEFNPCPGQVAITAAQEKAKQQFGLK